MTDNVICHPAHHVPMFSFTKLSPPELFKTYITLCTKCGQAVTFTAEGKPV